MPVAFGFSVLLLIGRRPAPYREQEENLAKGRGQQREQGEGQRQQQQQRQQEHLRVASFPSDQAHGINWGLLRELPLRSAPREPGLRQEQWRSTAQVHR